MTEKHSFSENYETTIQRVDHVECTTLDKEFLAYSSENKFLLKIDTQGSELFILEGARELFKFGKIKAVVIEVLTSDMYEGQGKWDEIFSYFSSFNFQFLDIMVAVRNPDGTIAEFDVIFVQQY